MAKTRRLGAILYDDFELLDLYGPLEMFGNVGAEVEIATVAPQRGLVRSAQGPATQADFDFASAPALDLLLLPGGIGTMAELERPAMLEFLRERVPRAEVTMSVCSGSAILAKAGVLDGRKATSNKLFFSLASDQSGAVDWVEEARWVEDGPFFTSSGVSAGTDMALAVIARLFGRERADTLAVLTEYEWQSDPSRDPFHAHLNQGDIAAYLEMLGRS